MSIVSSLIANTTTLPSEQRRAQDEACAAGAGRAGTICGGCGRTFARRQGLLSHARGAAGRVSLLDFIKTIGPANDSYPNADIELELAGFLAGAAARDPVDVRIIEDVMGLIVDDDAVDAYQDGLIEHALDLIAQRSKPLSMPRSPIEQMIDRACGVSWSGP